MTHDLWNRSSRSREGRPAECASRRNKTNGAASKTLDSGSNASDIKESTTGWRRSSFSHLFRVPGHFRRTPHASPRRPRYRLLPLDPSGRGVLHPRIQKKVKLAQTAAEEFQLPRLIRPHIPPGTLCTPRCSLPKHRGEFGALFARVPTGSAQLVLDAPSYPSKSVLLSPSPSLQEHASQPLLVLPQQRQGEGELWGGGGEAGLT